MMKFARKAGLALVLVSLAGCGGGLGPSAQPAGQYSTNFPLTESPISEGGKWVNGGGVGLDWTNVNTTAGKAIGTEGAIPYSDSTALLQNLTWANDQSAQGTAIVKKVTPNCGQEVELRLRSHIGPHGNTGYEVLYGLIGYLWIVRWNGPLGDFTVLSSQSAPQLAPGDGDILRATIVGNVITAYKNGAQMDQVTDSTYSGGSPGIGFNLAGAASGCPETKGDYGFSSFTALDSTQGPL